jgi:hypothetical protein
MEIFLSAALGLRFWKEACEWRRIGYQAWIQANLLQLSDTN